MSVTMPKTPIGKVIEVKTCDICQKVVSKKKLQLFCDLFLCRDCYRRYGYN